ncbi:hypothetical protein GCM10007036_18430 [Alsobacter metallidurans]|uniref:SGNH hydrolase-type esterase domain-containing protein n=1 Tax=Alsobacter metallidurans TaxID=340221 RepID=A0A917I6P6_9HYPH|nr:SGNH/GDSL hydrolase family protein [Alsobacter metallidurans]GGH17177.1 hypothetical protein GCM10007036_18430 [Alsobacter metallidurans]
MNAGLVGGLIGVLLASVGPAAADITIVAFGTSLTARGEWQSSLVSRLSECTGQSVRVETIAKSGASTDWALKQIEAVAAKRPDIVLVEFASNDAALNRWMLPSRSRNNMVALLTGLRRAAPAATIYVMAMSPVRGLRGLIRPFLRHYMETHLEVAHELGARTLDFRPAWAKLDSASLQAALPDGLHPKGGVASDIMVPLLAEAITGGSCR